MLGHVDEPLLVTTPIVHRHKLRALAATLGGTLLLATALFLAYRAPAWPLTSSVPTTSLYGVSGECGPTPPPFATDKVREAAKLFVDSLSDNVKPHTYYPDAAKQVPQWQLCTIVQQCLKPDYGTSVANLPAGSRTLFFQILAIINFVIGNGIELIWICIVIFPWFMTGGDWVRLTTPPERMLLRNDATALLLPPSPCSLLSRETNDHAITVV